MRLRTLTFAMALERWLRTVARDSERVAAISSVEMPLSAARSTSASREVSGLLPVSRAAATRSGSIQFTGGGETVHARQVDVDDGHVGPGLQGGADDPVAAVEFRDDLHVVLQRHRLASVARADRIYVLDTGRVAEQGTHAALMSADGGYSAMYRLQARQFQPT
jgi:hypothetical protein